MLGRLWPIVKDAATGFVNDECLSRGAAIAYYTIFSLAPLLVIATAVAGFFFGEQAARGELNEQIEGLVGATAAEAIQGMVAGAADTGRGTFSTLLGITVLLVVASGVFAELQGALNAIWKAEPRPEEGVITALVRGRALSIGLVAATGFLLLVSLVASAVITAFGRWLVGHLPGGEAILTAVNFAVSFALLAGLFAAIYKILPDRRLAWRDVGVGAVVTAFLFQIGKALIGLYIAYAAPGSTYGAAGSVVVVLVWVYYSAQIFLFGAEFTRAWAGIEGSRQAAPVPADAPTHRQESAAPLAEGALRAARPLGPPLGAAAAFDAPAVAAREAARAEPRPEESVWATLGGVMMLAALARRLFSRGGAGPTPGAAGAAASKADRGRRVSVR